MKKMFKRALLSLLSLALTFTMVQYTPVHVHAHDGKSLTSAEIIAKNYGDIDETVKAVLESGGLNVKEYFYEVPADSSLVTVDTKEKTVTAQSHKDQFGNKWNPVQVFVTEAGVEKEYARIGETNTWDLDGVGDQYTVRVVYSAYVLIDTDEQLRLLNSLYNLWYAYDFVSGYMQSAGDQVSTLELAIPELENELNKEKEKINNGLETLYAELDLQEGEDAVEKIQKLIKEAEDKKAKAEEALPAAIAKRDEMVAAGIYPDSVIEKANQAIADIKKAIQTAEETIDQLEKAIDLVGEAEKGLAELNKIETIVNELKAAVDLTDAQISLYNKNYKANDQYIEYLYSGHTISLRTEVAKLVHALEQLKPYKQYMGSYEARLTSIINKFKAILDDKKYNRNMEPLYFENQNGVKESLVDLNADLSDLNAAVIYIEDNRDLTLFENGDVITSLLLDECSISASVAMHDVNVVINAVAYDENGKQITLEETATITVDDGSKQHDILGLKDVLDFDGLVFDTFNKKLAEIEDGYVITPNGTYTKNMSSADTDKDGEIDTLTISYVPKKVNFVVEANGAQVSKTEVEYGSFVTLPAKIGEGSYEYVIDGIGFDQEQTYRVLKETTALRTETTVVKTVKPIFEVVAKDTYYQLNKITKDILLNKALLSPLTSYVALNESYPAEVTLEYDETNRVYVLKAPKYKAYIDDMEWVPVAYSVNGQEKVAMNGTTTDEIVGKVSDVEVFYELKVTKNASTGENVIAVTDELLKEWINLPYALVVDVKGQKEVLDTLASWTGEGGYLTMGNVIDLALGFIEGNYEKRYGKGSPEYEAIQTLRKVCLDDDSNLVVLQYVEMYKTLGLIAYYDANYGYTKYKEQLNTLVECLDIIVHADEFENVKDSLSGIAGAGEKVDQIEDILISLSDANDKLVEPNKYLNTAHADFDSLLDLLESEEAISKEGKILVNKVENTNNGLHDYYSVKVINELENFIYKIDLNVNGGLDDGKHFTYSFAVALEDLYDLDAINAKINEFIAQVDTKHYTLASDYTTKLPKPGDRANKNQTLEINYNVNKYDIRIEDEDGKKISTSTIEYTNHSMTLEASKTNEYYYVYVVAGKEYNTKNGALPLNITAGTVGNFDTLFVDGKLTIVRKEISLKEELGLELEAYVANLNKGFAGLNSGFILVENGGEYEVVLRIDPSEANSLTSGLMDMAMEIINAKYGYIALGKEDNAFFNKKITLQALINAVLYSDFSSKTLTDLFNENGQINDNVKLEGNNVVVGGNVNLNNEIGGLLLGTHLVLGTNPNNIEHNIPFYITLEDFGQSSKDFADVDKVLEMLENYVTFNTKNDELNIVTTLPNDGYKVLLAAMIYAGYADLDAVTEVEVNKFLQYFVDQYDELVHGDIALSSKVIQNTLNKLGINASVKEYATYIDGAIAVLKNLTLKVENGAITGELSADLNSVITKIEQIPDAVSSIIETELYVPVNAEITNLGTGYDAIVIDVFNDNKEIYKSVDFSNDIEKDITKLADNSVVILLADAKELKVKENVILDLNGFDVESIKVADGAHLRIFDSAIKDGTVYSLEGKDITVTGGQYKSSFAMFGLVRTAINVEKYLPEGYVQNTDGTVTHRFFSITETADGIVIELNPDFTDLTKQDVKEMDYKHLALDLALTLGLRYYNTSSLTIDGNTIAGLGTNFSDFVALYADSTKLELANKAVDILNCTGLTNFVNELIVELADLAGMAADIRDSGVLATYDIETTPLTAGVKVVKDSKGNYVTGGVTDNKAVARRERLIIKINQETAEKYKVADILEFVDEFLTIDTKETYINVTDIKVNKLAAAKDAISTDASMSAKATIKVKDAKYTVLMATVLAYGTKDSAVKAELTKALGAYICDGDSDGLVKAMEKRTVADMYNAVVKATQSDVTLAKMFKNLGINLKDFDGAAAAEAKLDSYLASAMAGIKYLGIHDSKRKIVVEGSATIERADRVKVTLVLNLVADNTGCNHAYGATVYVDPTCEEAGSETRTCGVCGHKDVVVVPALGHSFTNYVSNNDATCTEDGTKSATCDNGCGTTDTLPDVGSAKGHNHVLDATTVKEATCTEEGYTGDKVCACGDKVLGTTVPAKGHKYTNYVSNNDATCTEDGTKSATCDNGCGTTDTLPDVGSAKGHNHVLDATTVKEATCTEEGYTGDKVCACGDKVLGTTVPAKGHKYTNYVSNNDATCTEDGTKSATCDNGCGTTDTLPDVGSAKGHNHVLDATTVKEATCTEEGYTGDKVCACGDKVLGTTVPAKGHKYTNYVSNNDATCTEDGTKSATCDNGCGTTDTLPDVGSAKGHNHVLDATTVKEATCTEEGYTGDKVCACGDKVLGTTVPAKGHKYTNYVSNNDATCTEDGTKSATCDNGCGTTDTLPDVGSAKGHNHVLDATTVKEATCTEEGYTGDKVCACGDKVLGTTVPAKGHKYTNYVSNNDATCTEDGTKSATCDNGCGTTDTLPDVGSAKGHNHVLDATTVKEATCTEEGYTGDKVCACGDKVLGTTVPAKGHTYTDTVVNPTCTEEGYTLHTCACGHSYKDTIVPATGHNHVLDTTTVKEATCTEEGYTGDKVCACGDKVLGTTVPAKGHTYTDTVVNPTCTEEGYTLHTCACGHSYKDTIVPATGHNHVLDLTTVKDATCTEDGYTGDQVCACGDKVLGTTVPAFGHDSHIVNAKAPTCTKDGYTGDERCKVCNTLIKEGTVVKATGHKYVNGKCEICGDKKPATSDNSLVEIYAACAMLCLAGIAVLKKKRDLLTKK